MKPSKGRRRKWGELFNIFAGAPNVQEMLRRRYIEKRRYASQLAYHAERMQYPQFRERLAAIAADANRHSQWIADKLREVGGTLPDVPEIPLSAKNSWQFLLEDLEEQGRDAAELLVQINAAKDQFPLVADMLQRIYEEGVKHREEIRAMLMRSDPQAHLAA